MPAQREKPKAIFVGSPRVGAAIQQIRPEWDFQPPVSTIKGFMAGLREGTISADTQIIFFLDSLLKSQPADSYDFEMTIAQMAPFAVVCVVSYFPEMKEHIKSLVEEAKNRYALNDGPLYFIDPSNPNVDIADAVNKYIADPRADQAVVDILTNRSRDKMILPTVDPSAEIIESAPVIGQKHGKIVAVTSSKGGSGKSTIAILLATYMAKASIAAVNEGKEADPLKVLIVDLDVRDGQLGFVTNNSKPTVLHVVQRGVSKESIEEAVIHDSRLSCDLLLAPKRPKFSENTTPEFYIELLQSLRGLYDYIILDTSVNYLDPLLEKVAYPTADQIVFVSDIVINSVFSMTRWIQEVTFPKEQKGMGINPRKVGIVINKYLSDVEMSSDKIAKSAMGLNILTIVPSNPKLIAYAANLQQMDMLLRQNDILNSIARLGRAIVGRSYQFGENIRNI